MKYYIFKILQVISPKAKWIIILLNILLCFFTIYEIGICVFQPQAIMLFEGGWRWETVKGYTFFQISNLLVFVAVIIFGVIRKYQKYFWYVVLVWVLYLGYLFLELKE